MAKLLPGDCIAWDSIERRLHDLQRHLITRRDLASRFGFAPGVKHLSSQQAYLAWQLHHVLFHATVRRVVSDNGQEFAPLRLRSESLRDRALAHLPYAPRR